MENIWLFLSALSLGNSSTSRDSHRKWIREELHVFLPLHPVLSKDVSHARLPSMWPGFESRRRRHKLCGLSLLLVLSLAPRGFSSGTSVFRFSFKTNTCKFQFDLERTDMFQRVLNNSQVLRGSTNYTEKKWPQLLKTLALSSG